MKILNFEKVISFIKKHWLAVFAVAGAVLLIISFMPDRSKKQEVSVNYLSDDYVKDIENKLVSVLSDMLGTENISVMVTLDSSSENIYADATKINTDTTENLAGQDSTKTSRKDSEEKEYIIVKDENGNEQALIVTTVMPQIRGVLVVCPNGDNEAVSETVRTAVVTVLNVAPKKVCVTGINK